MSHNEVKSWQHTNWTMAELSSTLVAAFAPPAADLNLCWEVVNAQLFGCQV